MAGPGNGSEPEPLRFPARRACRTVRADKAGLSWMR